MTTGVPSSRMACAIVIPTSERCLIGRQSEADVTRIGCRTWESTVHGIWRDGVISRKIRVVTLLADAPDEERLRQWACQYLAALLEQDEAGTGPSEPMPRASNDA